MGRAKMKMELIRKEKARSLTFKKRKEGLLKKVHELTTLCDVSACMIIYENGAVLPELWPKNTNEVNRVIGVYKSKDCAGNKTFGLSDFFHNRAKKAEEELAKIKKKNMEAKYPTRSEWLTEFGEPQLRDFSASLANKAAHVKSIIKILRTNQVTTTFGNPNFHHHHHHQMLMQQQFLPKIDHHSHYSMFLMNQNHQFQPASSSTYNIQLPSSSFSNTAGGSWPLDPMISHSLAAEYYAPPPPPRNMQTQGKWENEDDVGQDDIDQFFINNYSAC